MSGNSDSDFWNIVFGFLTGVASTAFVSLLVYNRQRKEMENFHRGLTLDLLTAINQGNEIDSQILEVTTKIKSELDKSLRLC